MDGCKDTEKFKHYSKNIKNPIDIREYLNQLRTIYKSYKNPPSITFKKFAIEHLGPKLYNDFVISNGYSDYENEDVYEVLYHYQIEDNAPGWIALDVSWSSIVHTLCNKIGNQNILASSNSIKISSYSFSYNPYLEVETELITDSVAYVKIGGIR